MAMGQPDLETGRREAIDILSKQLERMRSMHYGYYSQFFTAIHFFTVVILAMIALSLWPQMRALILALPFFVIYAGGSCAYLITYNLFARVYATALEKRLNQLLGADLLVAHMMEDVFIYKTASPKFVGIDLANPTSAISAITLSYLISGVVVTLIGVCRAGQLLPILTPKFPLLSFYWPLLIVWGALHLGYLLWYFLSASHEKKITRIVEDAYGL
jgi:hypothetical protein